MRANDKNAESFETLDPYENINRKSYVFTDVVDRKILEPIADYYIEYIPDRMRRSIGHFYDNLLYPNVVLNVFLQGKMRQGLEDTVRFVVNSSVGVAGLFDVASRMGLPPPRRRFWTNTWRMGHGRQNLYIYPFARAQQ